MIFFSLGWLFVLIGAIGIFIPLLPTTPFLILAACLFSKSSTRSHTWLIQQKLFGPAIKDWETGHVIRRRTKITASTVLIASIIGTITLCTLAFWIQITMIAISAIVLTFIWTRPENINQTS